jgi:hypothetical protein
MGDYTKLIVHANVRVPEDKLREKIEELGLCTSAYHCDGVIESIGPRSGYGEAPYIALTLVGQTKWGCGQDEFLDWLAPFVIQGSGPKDAWSIQFTEYSAEPVIRTMPNTDELNGELA